MKVDIIVPAAGESVTEADIASWSKSDGDFVEMDDVLLELETDKASMELNAEATGTLTIVIEEGETVKVGDVIGYITPGEGSAPKPADSTAESTPASAEAPANEAPAAVQASTSNHYAKGHPSPAAANVLASANISADQVQGSGKDGRITKSDAEAAKATIPAAATPSAEKNLHQPFRFLLQQVSVQNAKKKCLVYVVQLRNDWLMHNIHKHYLQRLTKLI